MNKEYQNIPELYRTLLENPYIGICITDGKGKVLMVNEAQTRITNIPVEVFVGHDMHDLANRGVVSVSSTVEVLNQKQPVDLHQITHKGRSYDVKGFPILDKDGEIQYVVSYLLDISDMMQMKALNSQLQEDMRKMEDKYRELLAQFDGKCNIIYQSEVMQKLVEKVARCADSDATILITGASGTGKELIANLLHEKSRRRNQAFMKVNCAAIPESLLESEFFGYEGGAFTGALKGGKTGMFESANNGTIFLDEIGEMPLHLQAKILRVLQEQKVRKIGSNHDTSIDVRVLSATNLSLLEQVERKQFRKDLYYRLNIIELRVPSLKDRREDIPLLIHYFLRQFNEKYEKKKRFSADAIQFLCGLEYNGNVRELKNIIESLIVQSENNVISLEEALEILNFSRPAAAGGDVKRLFDQGMSLKDMLADYERQILTEYFGQYKNAAAVAKQLKVDRTTISRKKTFYDL